MICVLGKQRGFVPLNIQNLEFDTMLMKPSASMTCWFLETVRDLADCRLQQNLGALPLWSGTPAQFRQRFNSLCALMGLEEAHQFRPYSLRRGATHFFQCTNSMETALLRGRWKSTRVARLYISDALSFIPAIKCSQHTRDFIRTFSW